LKNTRTGEIGTVARERLSDKKNLDAASSGYCMPYSESSEVHSRVEDSSVPNKEEK
jgi:hypothetical protein